MILIAQEDPDCLDQSRSPKLHHHFYRVILLIPSANRMHRK